LENNLAPNTQIGKLIIEDPDDPEKCFGTNEHHDMYTNDDQEAKYSRGGEFLENMMCSNVLEFGHRWLGLGDLYQVLSDLDEYYKYNGYIGRPINYNIRDAFYFTKNNYVEAFKIIEDYMPSQPFIFDNHLSSEELEALRKEVEKGATL